MTTVAAVDCGTNSIRLLVLRRDGEQTSELAREVRLARLGQGVDATRRFHPEALERTRVILAEFADIITSHGADRTRLVATSAARDVTNRDELERIVQDALGVELEVISGDEEARLSATGVLSGLEVSSPALVVDIGGGSTELVLVKGDGELAFAQSLDVGAVRLRERFLRSDPPTPDEVTAAREFVGDLLEALPLDLGAVATTIGVAGTVASVAARALDLTEYRREAVHRHTLSRDDIHAATTHWLTTPVAQVEQEPCMHPLRAQVIAGGSLILDEISGRVPRGEVTVSETDILDGIALAMLT